MWPEAVLAKHYAIEHASIEPVLRGHTNESFAVRTPDAHYVIRRGWAGKPLERAVREERVLSALVGARMTTAAPQLTAEVPQLVPSNDGALHVVDDGRIVHLFRGCHGELGPRWLTGADGDADRVGAAMTTLAALHASLAPMAVDAPVTGPWQWLTERIARVRALGIDADVLATIERVIAGAPIDGPVQWLHGDYHLANLLWRDDQVAAVVDFDDTALGATASEVAMALFALARLDAGEDAFHYDTSLWDAGLAAYMAATGTPLWFDRDRLQRVFCAYQVLIHLEANARGLWSLEPGIGYWPCLRTLMRG